MRLRAVPVEGGRVSVLAATLPAMEGVITRVDDDHKRFEVRAENGLTREFALRLATGRFENTDGNWIKFQY